VRRGLCVQEPVSAATGAREARSSRRVCRVGDDAAARGALEVVRDRATRGAFTKGLAQHRWGGPPGVGCGGYHPLRDWVTGSESRERCTGGSRIRELPQREAVMRRIRRVRKGRPLMPKEVDFGCQHGGDGAQFLNRVWA
jgi:hypothetical protein